MYQNVGKIITQRRQIMSNPVDQKALEEMRRLKFHQALFQLHGDIEAMTKDEANPFFKSKYVPLPKMIRTLKPILQKHGFILNQPVDVANTQQGLKNAVLSRLVHVETGLSEEARMVLPDIDDMQKLGGAITYARRFTLSSVVGLEEADDDGETAVGRGSRKGKVSNKDKF